jgi:2-iminobutanoate/2-iminopropanoate deaminase
MEKKCIHAEKAPPAVGPYSHAVVANGFVFASGQCPFAPDGSGPLRGTIEEETHLVMQNVKAVLEAAGAGLPNVVKTTAYLLDMANFQRFNAVYKEYFPENPPARTCIQAARLPLDVQVEVEVIALLPGA